MKRAIATTTGAVLTGANFVLAAPIGYLGAMTVLAWSASRRSGILNGSDAPTTRFLLTVPAHNEATTLPILLDTLAAVDYPPALLRVHLVADNCDDDTADLARAAGAEVHERFDTANPGKGPALNWLLQRLLDAGEPFDAVVFVDADTSISTDFLKALDRRFRAGSVVVQGHYGVRDPFGSTPATLRYCALACRHHLRPLARTAIGGSCGLFGNGMAMTRSLAADRKWTDHLVEDMEFQVELFLNDIMVDYEPDAVVQAEMPSTLAASASQHRRWEFGRLDIARRYVPRLMSRLVRRRGRDRLAAADMIADMTTPPLSMVAAAAVTSAAIGCAAAVLLPSRTSRLNALLGCSFLATICLHVVAALRLVDAPPRAYRSLLHAPELVAWKIMLLVRSRTGSAPNEWIRTRRNAEVGAW